MLEAKKSVEHPYIIFLPQNIHPYSCLTPVKITNRDERGERQPLTKQHIIYYKLVVIARMVQNCKPLANGNGEKLRKRSEERMLYQFWHDDEDVKKTN